MFSPVQTYISMGDGIIKPEDSKLICVFDKVISAEFQGFEKKSLLGNTFFKDYFKNEDQGVYIFDLKDRNRDWLAFLSGKYSEISDDLKMEIRDYFGKNSNEYEYIDTYLYPDKYFKLYAKLLHIEEEVLKNVGELCDRYDPVKENLKLFQNNFELLKKSN